MRAMARRPELVGSGQGGSARGRDRAGQRVDPGIQIDPRSQG